MTLRDFIRCKICNKRLQEITAQHLRAEFCQKAQREQGLNIRSVPEYKAIFPNKQTISDYVLKKRREGSRRGGERLSERRKEDPKLDAYLRDASRKAGKISSVVRKIL